MDPAARPLSPAAISAAARALDDLLAAVGAGDEKAFGELYGQTLHPVMALVRLLLRDTALAEEVTQEVFLTVWLSAGRFDADRGRAGAWILAIARSRSIDRIKSVQAARERDHAFATRPETIAAAPEDEALLSLERHHLRSALSVLTAIQRQAILLAFFGGHSYPETAALLGVPLPTLKARIRDGLLRLRHHLDAGRTTDGGGLLSYGC